ncbi:hypothetical protein, partial [Amycolatopsis sp. NPDC051371]|uniref:hypothetical protein n=1 Tax=Amycolatopsis sp. NPDC051371 TaxID=3155800 RepID=UPI00341E279D
LLLGHGFHDEGHPFQGLAPLIGGVCQNGSSPDLNESFKTFGGAGADPWRGGGASEAPPSRSVANESFATREASKESFATFKGAAVRADGGLQPRVALSMVRGQGADATAASELSTGAGFVSRT